MNDISNRINRLIGQLKGIEKMLNNKRECSDVLQQISAVKNNQVYSDIDPALLLRPGPRIIDAILEINKRRHPSEIALKPT